MGPHRRRERDGGEGGHRVLVKEVFRERVLKNRTSLDWILSSNVLFTSDRLPYIKLSVDKSSVGGNQRGVS